MAGLKDALAGIKPESLSLDSMGRVVLDDAKVAEALKEAGGAPDLSKAASGVNIFCSGSAPANMREILSMLQEGKG